MFEQISIIFSITILRIRLSKCTNENETEILDWKLTFDNKASSWKLNFGGSACLNFPKIQLWTILTSCLHALPRFLTYPTPLIQLVPTDHWSILYRINIKVIINECFFWFYTFLIFFVICRDYTFCFLRFKIFHVYKLKKSSLYHLPLGGVGPRQGGGHEDCHGRHHHGHLAHPQHGLEADHLPRDRWVVFASLLLLLLCQSYSVSSWIMRCEVNV